MVLAAPSAARSRRVGGTDEEGHGRWRLLRRAVDDLGGTIEFRLPPARGARVAEQILEEVVRGPGSSRWASHSSRSPSVAPFMPRRAPVACRPGVRTGTDAPGSSVRPPHGSRENVPTAKAVAPATPPMATIPPIEHGIEPPSEQAASRHGRLAVSPRPNDALGPRCRGRGHGHGADGPPHGGLLRRRPPRPWRIMGEPIDALVPLSATARRSLAFDPGLELAFWRELGHRLAAQAWFCGPQARRQKPAVGNADGRLRRPLPRDTDAPSSQDRSLGAIRDRWRLAGCWGRTGGSVSEGTVRHMDGGGETDGLGSWVWGLLRPSATAEPPSPDRHGERG